MPSRCNEWLLISSTSIAEWFLTVSRRYLSDDKDRRTRAELCNVRVTSFRPSAIDLSPIDVGFLVHFIIGDRKSMDLWDLILSSTVKCCQPCDSERPHVAAIDYWLFKRGSRREFSAVNCRSPHRPKKIKRGCAKLCNIGVTIYRFVTINLSWIDVSLCIISLPVPIHRPIFEILYYVSLKSPIDRVILNSLMLQHVIPDFFNVGRRVHFWRSIVDHDPQEKRLYAEFLWPRCHLLPNFSDQFIVNQCQVAYKPIRHFNEKALSTAPQ